jgi:hypothetical protein
MFMSAADYRESLRRYRPRVFLNGDAVESVADEPRLAPGINAVGLTYDYALRTELAPVMTATQKTSGQLVNRMLHIPTTSSDLLNKQVRAEALPVVAALVLVDPVRGLEQGGEGVAGEITHRAAGLLADDAHGFQHRQAAARHPDLRHAPPRPSRLGRADRHASGPGRRPTIRPPRGAFRSS